MVLSPNILLSLKLEDKAVVAAMSKGASLTVQGNSSRGTPTVDTYSLQGFSAAYKAITDTCK